MGYRYYEVVTQRKQKVRAKNRTDLAENTNKPNGAVVYDDEVVVSVKETTLNKPLTLDTPPVYIPSQVLKRPDREEAVEAPQDADGTQEIVPEAPQPTPQQETLPLAEDGTSEVPHLRVVK